MPVRGVTETQSLLALRLESESTDEGIRAVPTTGLSGAMENLAREWNSNLKEVCVK